MKVAIVGGSSGLGYELAKMASEVHDVWALSRRGSGPDNCRNCIYDIDKGDYHDAFVRADYVVISAGKGAMYGPHQIEPAIMHEMITTNLYGPLLLANKIIYHWRRQRMHGRLAFVTSTAGDGPSHGLGIYAACKKGLEGFVRAEGHHQQKYGIELIALSLGWFESPMTAELEPGVRRAAEKRCPQGRFATMAETVAFCRSKIFTFYDSGTVYKFWSND